MDTSWAAPSMEETRVEKRLIILFIMQHKEEFWSRWFLIFYMKTLKSTSIFCSCVAKKRCASFPAAETQHEKCVRNLLYRAEYFTIIQMLWTIFWKYMCYQVSLQRSSDIHFSRYISKTSDSSSCSLSVASTYERHKLRWSGADIPKWHCEWERSHSQTTINRASVNFP